MVMTVVRVSSVGHIVAGGDVRQLRVREWCFGCWCDRCRLAMTSG